MTLASTLHWSAMAAFLLGERAELRAWVGEFVALTAEHTLAHFTQWAQIWRCWLAAEFAEARANVAPMREALSAIRVTGAQFWSPFYMALLADVHRRAGETDQALEVIGKALEHVEQTDERVYEAELHRLKGETLLSRSPSSIGDAEACFGRALSIARGQAARWCELRAATDLARLWQARGEAREAHDLLEPAHGWFTEGFDTSTLQEAATLLRTLR